MITQWSINWPYYITSIRIQLRGSITYFYFLSGLSKYKAVCFVFLSNAYVIFVYSCNYIDCLNDQLSFEEQQKFSQIKSYFFLNFCTSSVFLIIIQNVSYNNTVIIARTFQLCNISTCVFSVSIALVLKLTLSSSAKILTSQSMNFLPLLINAITISDTR